MIFIGGVSDKTVMLEDLNVTTCRQCNGTHRMQVFKHYYFFHFFFIPIWKWKLNYYVTCESCQSTMQIPLEKGKNIEQGEMTELTFWDLEVINEGVTPQIICSHCHKKTEKTYHYCPYCGDKI